MVFRTLAKRSVLGFGRHADLSVTQLLTMNNHSYLTWVYYNCSHISFNDEILEILGITKERQIKKPGVDPSYYERFRGSFSPLYDESLNARATKKFIRADRKARKISYEHGGEIDKAKRQRVNQGHYRRK
jgi:hypothetical protein